MIKSIRWKILFVFIISILAASITVVGLILFALALGRNFKLFYDILKLLYDTIGVLPLGVLAGILFFIIYFFLLSQKTIRYLEEITQSLDLIAKGNFDVEIPIKSNNELGVLAANINLMASQIKKSIEEERNAEKKKNELVTGVSHDLRTPLTSILGYLGLIVNDQYKDEIVLRYYIDIAHTKALHLKGLIDQLFEYTRVSYGGMKVEMKKVNLVELMEQLIEDFAPSMQEKNMKCQLQVSNESIFVWIDPNLMVRVFENLISNAIRYGHKGKAIDIEIDEEKDTVVKVINYGELIESQELPYLFERFYRVEKSRSKESGGTGLGLAIAKNIVDLHNGEIKAYSSLERTVFEVRLRRNKRKLLVV